MKLAVAVLHCCALTLIAWIVDARPLCAQGSKGVCMIEVRDRENSFPVPLVELKTVNGVRFVSDNAGVIAMDAHELFDQETYFGVSSPGYEATKDGFGFAGVRVIPRAGEKLVVYVQRTSIAKRLGRLTGSGLYHESQRCGRHLDWKDDPWVGCDSVQMTIYGGKPFWSWGDTSFQNYPLGNFAMSGARTTGVPVTQTAPPIMPRYALFLNEKGRTKGIAPISGPGPTWLTGYAALKDRTGNEHLVAIYRKIEKPMNTYELGLCEWNATTETFERVKVLWSKSMNTEEPKVVPSGHTVIDRSTPKPTLLFGDPFPTFRCEATYERWLDSSSWQAVESPQELLSANDEKVVPHSGSIAFHPYRKRWVAVFMQKFGKPSAFGELWYAESDHPTGPWGKAVKILSHENYTFYNPRLWGEFVEADSKLLLFEGTYTEQFANRPIPTPRYDYNQILYRIDLDDPKLAPAQVETKH